MTHHQIGVIPLAMLVVESPRDAAHGRGGRFITALSHFNLFGLYRGKDLVGNVAAMWYRGVSTKQDGDKAINCRALRYVRHLLLLAHCSLRKKGLPGVGKGKPGRRD